MHAGAGGAEVVHGIHIADVEALLGRSLHTIQGVAENFRVRLLVSHKSGVGDGVKTTGNSALLQHVFDPAIGIGDHRDLVTFADGAQLFGSARTNRVPVAGVANTADELVADGIVFVFVVNADFGKQLRIE